MININMDLLQFYIILEKIRKSEKPKEKLSFDDSIWGLGWQYVLILHICY